MCGGVSAVSSTDEAASCHFSMSVASISFTAAGRQTALFQHEEFSVNGRQTDDKHSVRLHLHCKHVNWFLIAHVSFFAYKDSREALSGWGRGPGHRTIIHT